MSLASDVVVVGGGAAGCSVAHYLALAGAKVTLVEREGIATQASGFSAGGLNPLQGAGIPGPSGPLALESYRMHLSLWDELKETTGIDYEGRIISLLKLAFDDVEMSDLRATQEAFNQVEGFSADWLAGQDVLKLEPRLSPGVVSGVLATGNAALDSYKYTLALSESAQKLGASLQAGVVHGLEAEKTRVTGVRLQDETLACDNVVLAMGPWSRQAEAWLGGYIPVDPLKGEILRLSLQTPLGQDISGAGASLYAKPDGLVWCGSTEEWRGFDRMPSDSARESLLQRAIRLIPDLAKAKLVQHTACLRPVTPDWLPIIGRMPDWDNVYLATGAGRKGILLSPAIGKAVTDLITEGETQLPISAFGPERFVQVTSP
jgi:glycine oxidase